jgi:hypothetical protein
MWIRARVSGRGRGQVQERESHADGHTNWLLLRQKML